MQSLGYSLQWVLRPWRSSQAKRVGVQRPHAGCDFCSADPGSAAWSVFQGRQHNYKRYSVEEAFLLGPHLTEDPLIFKQKEGSPLILNFLFFSFFFFFVVLCWLVCKINPAFCFIDSICFTNCERLVFSS